MLAGTGRAHTLRARSSTSVTLNPNHSRRARQQQLRLQVLVTATQAGRDYFKRKLHWRLSLIDLLGAHQRGHQRMRIPRGTPYEGAYRQQVSAHTTRLLKRFWRLNACYKRQQRGEPTWHQHCGQYKGSRSDLATRDVQLTPQRVQAPHSAEQQGTGTVQALPATEDCTRFAKRFAKSYTPIRVSACSMQHCSRSGWKHIAGATFAVCDFTFLPCPSSSVRCHVMLAVTVLY